MQFVREPGQSPNTVLSRNIQIQAHIDAIARLPLLTPEGIERHDIVQVVAYIFCLRGCKAVIPVISC